MLVRVGKDTSFELTIERDLGLLTRYYKGESVGVVTFHIQLRYSMLRVLRDYFDFWYENEQEYEEVYIKFRDAIDEARSIDFLRPKPDYDVWVQTEETYLSTVKTPKGIDLMVQVNKCWNDYDDHAYVETELQERGTDVIVRFYSGERGVGVQDAIYHVYKYVEDNYGG